MPTLCHFRTPDHGPRHVWAALMTAGLVVGLGSTPQASGTTPTASQTKSASIAPPIALPAPPAHARTARKPARLLVTAEEWLCRLSRPKLRAKRAVIQLFNRGEDVHDLRMRRIGRLGEVGTAEIAPGDVGLLRTKLRRGAYSLWCSIPGHRELGMEARLKVRKRR